MNKISAQKEKKKSKRQARMAAKSHSFKTTSAPPLPENVGIPSIITQSWFAFSPLLPNPGNPPPFPPTKASSCDSLREAASLSFHG